MKKKLLIIVCIETLVLIAFSFNIYYEISNINKAEEWYVAILDEDMKNKSEEEALSILLSHGFKTIETTKEKDGSATYIISPPFDQGLFATLSNRFFFDVVLHRDKNGKITTGLHK